LIAEPLKKLNDNPQCPEAGMAMRVQIPREIFRSFAVFTSRWFCDGCRMVSLPLSDESDTNHIPPLGLLQKHVGTEECRCFRRLSRLDLHGHINFAV
jgi:hypothetical protein